MPGYEYHYLDEDGPPRSTARSRRASPAPASEVDPARADASPWLERLPVIREFRRKLGAALGLVAALCIAAGSARAAEPLDARLAQVYAQVCATCHQLPATGAPLTGDAAAWRTAAAAGRDAMLAQHDRRDPRHAAARDVRLLHRGRPAPR